MKFKRLSEDKIQIIVSSEDLEKRQVKKWDLMPNSPKAQELFQEMLEEAYHECGFEVDSETQLMVEAYPMTAESLVIIVTKIKQKSFIKDIIPRDDEDDDELFDDLEDEDLSEFESENLVYVFKDFEDVVQVSKVIWLDYLEKCSVYKYKNAYYLAFPSSDNLSDHAIGMLGEYGTLVHSAECFFKEHGQTMIKDNALTVLASL